MNRELFSLALALSFCLTQPAFAEEEESTETKLPTKMSVEEISYVAHVSRKIRKNWPKPEVDERKELTVSFLVDKDGEISELKVLKSTGSEEIDQNGLDAITKSAPFEKPPEEMKTPKKLRLSFVFQKEKEEVKPEVKDQEEENKG